MKYILTILMLLSTAVASGKELVVHTPTDDVVLVTTVLDPGTIYLKTTDSFGGFSLKDLKAARSSSRWTTVGRSIGTTATGGISALLGWLSYGLYNAKGGFENIDKESMGVVAASSILSFGFGVYSLNMMAETSQSVRLSSVLGKIINHFECGPEFAEIETGAVFNMSPEGRVIVRDTDTIVVQKSNLEAVAL